MTQLLRVARNVGNLPAMAAFYEALGFVVDGAACSDPALAICLGVTNVQVLRMRRGGQEIELSACEPVGGAYPAGAAANDLGFQHLALVTPDIETSYARAVDAGAVAISVGGPETLPRASGGVTAWKFRDPDGHPLEFLQFPDAARNAVSGYDHTAISVSDVSGSVAFYARYGFSQTAAQVNRGIEQERLDGLPSVIVDVVALALKQATPHLELLHYRTPRGRAAADGVARIGADRLVLRGDDGGVTLALDPDGHAILLDGR